MKLFSISRLFHSFIYKIQCFFKPWNVVKITSLDRYYHEKDEIMLHACFQVLVNFVEKEMIPMHDHEPFDLIEDEAYYREHGYDEETIKIILEQCKEQNERSQEILSLYKWWKEKPIREKEYWDKELKLKESHTQQHYNELHDWLEKDEKEEDEMLQRLMKVRRCLWT